jgi:hypothetical protein
MRRLALLALLCLAGCVRVPVVPPDPPLIRNVLCWNADLAGLSAVIPWRRKTDERFGEDCILVVCHGGERWGEWWLAPDSAHESLRMPVKNAVAVLRDVYGPRRKIVLIVCNPSHELLRTPGVIYATELVYCIPDSYWPLPREGPNVGRFEGFRQNPN